MKKIIIYMLIFFSFVLASKAKPLNYQIMYNIRIGTSEKEVIGIFKKNKIKYKIYEDDLGVSTFIYIPKLKFYGRRIKAIHISIDSNKVSNIQIDYGKTLEDFILLVDVLSNNANCQDLDASDNTASYYFDDCKLVFDTENCYFNIFDSIHKCDE